MYSPTGNYLWKGWSQGRHGNKGNLGAYLEFKIENGQLIHIASKGYPPIFSELMTATIRLDELKIKTEEKQKKAAAAKIESEKAAEELKKQTKLF